MDSKKHIEKILQKHVKGPIVLEIPPNQELGDYAFPCFSLAKVRKKAPVQIAKDIVKEIKLDKIITKIIAQGPYVNFFVDKTSEIKNILSTILNQKEKFGQQKSTKKTFLIEYFHANTHKGVHVGHIRNITFAESLCRILQAAGNKVIRVNYQGDIGPHVAKCLWGYKNLHEKEPKKHKGIWLGKIYSKASKAADENKDIEEEIRKINNQIYAKDPKLLKDWKKTRKYCLDDFQDFYKEFGVKFDRLYFESEVEERGKEIVQDMLKKGIAIKSEGAIILDLEEYNLGIYVVLTKDGNALYSTKDFALAELKNKEFKFDRSIHVVGAEQIMHFKQLFKSLELYKSPMAKKSEHIPYGLVMLAEGKMSSRDGTMILFQDLKEKLITTIQKETKSRNPDLSSKEINTRSLKIAYAALKFPFTNRESNKEMTFDWEYALSFEGETGPYLQYTYARIASILRQEKASSKYVSSLLVEPEEIALTTLLSNYENTIVIAAQKRKIHLIARFLLDLAQSYNNFYHRHQVIKADSKELKLARLALSAAVKQVLKNGLYLLGIDTVEEM